VWYFVIIYIRFDVTVRRTDPKEYLMKKIALITGAALAIDGGNRLLVATAGHPSGLWFMVAGHARTATKVAFVASTAAITVRVLNNRSAQAA
jgi:hypothetical protein